MNTNPKNSTKHAFFHTTDEVLSHKAFTGLPDAEFDTPVKHETMMWIHIDIVEALKMRANRLLQSYDQ